MKKNKTKPEKCYCQDTELSVPHYTDDHEQTTCGNCGRPATHSIGIDMNRCDRCADL